MTKGYAIVLKEKRHLGCMFKYDVWNTSDKYHKLGLSRLLKVIVEIQPVAYYSWFLNEPLFCGLWSDSASLVYHMMVNVVVASRLVVSGFGELICLKSGIYNLL